MSFSSFPMASGQSVLVMKTASFFFEIKYKNFYGLGLEYTIIVNYFIPVSESKKGPSIVVLALLQTFL